MRVRARYAWPAGLAAWGAAWYASESLRHRREQGHGYQLRGERLDASQREFLRAAEALTGAPVSDGNDVELLINGDRIFPAFLETSGPRALARHAPARRRPGRSPLAGRVRRELARGDRRRARRARLPSRAPPRGRGRAYAARALPGGRRRHAFVQALCDAARRGVHVRALVAGPHIDKEFVRVAGRGAYATLLDCGVEVFEYQPTLLHAKTLCIDGAWASVGSVNFDNRSFQLHDEATLCVQSERFAALLGEQFERDLDVSEEIRPGRWRDRPLRQRALERVLTLARREL